MMPSPSAQASSDWPAKPDIEIAIVGTGFSGIGAACHLKQNRIDAFVMLEKAADLGGVWRDNNYPGLAVDVPIELYSYEFEPWAGFTRSYAPRDEVLAYQRHVAAKYGIEPHMRFSSGVQRATFDPTNHLWRLELEGGSRLCVRFLINATGFFTDVKFPNIEGLEQFNGQLVHPAKWDPGLNLQGQRVAIIGTGATAVQLVPTLARIVDRMTVYQRTPIWVLPKGDRAFTAQESSAAARNPQRILRKRRLAYLKAFLFWDIGFLRYNRFPWLYRSSAKSLEKVLRDKVTKPDIQEKLLPDYTLFCKRPAVTDEYWPAFNRDNVELVTEPITRITAEGVMTHDGRVVPVDVLIAATGYSLYDRWSPVTYDVIGLNSQNLGEYWMQDGFQAFQGISVPGFPNFFTYTGPYSITGVTFFDMIRAVSIHIVRCLKRAKMIGARSIEVTPRAHARDAALVRAKQRDTPILAGNCKSARSYYLDARGDAPIIRPESAFRQWWRARTFRLSNYRFSGRA